MDWYHELKHPALTPPDKVFAPTWTILYLMIFLSLLVFIRDGNLSQKIVPLSLFSIQIFLNLIWSPVFFGKRKIKLAMIIILLLWISIIAVIISFYPYSRLSVILLMPYFLWVTFAAYLNYKFWRLN